MEPYCAVGTVLVSVSSVNVKSPDFVLCSLSPSKCRNYFTARRYPPVCLQVCSFITHHISYFTFLLTVSFFFFEKYI